MVRHGECWSLPSSLEPSRVLRGTVSCTRACLRMLLRTLKQRPQPSNGHVNATGKMVRNAFNHVKSSLTFLACMTVQVYLTKSINCRARYGVCSAETYLQTAGPIESFTTVATLVLGCRCRQNRILRGAISHTGGRSIRRIRVTLDIRRFHWFSWLSIRRVDKSRIVRASSSTRVWPAMSGHTGCWWS